MHTLCRHCIEPLISAPGQKFWCPACQHECQVPREGVCGFPKNFFLNDLRELLQEPKKLRTSGAPQSEQIECDNAKYDDDIHEMAVTFCADCAEFYCETCKAFHKKSGVTREHELTPVADVDLGIALAIRAQKGNPKCGEHPNTRVDFYCDTCDNPVCAKCCLLKHKQHECRKVTAVGEEYQKKLEQYIQVTNVHIRNLEVRLKELKTSPHAIQQDTNKVRQEVHQVVKEIRDLVTKREQDLLQQIQDDEQQAPAAVAPSRGH